MVLQTTRLTVVPDNPFDFRSTAYSHGWVALAPTGWNDETGVMERIQRTVGGQVVQLMVSASGTSESPAVEIEVNHVGPVGTDVRNDVVSAVAHMLRLDEDLSEFYSLCVNKGGRWASLPAGAGRLLRSPTLFEDVIKTICTTNIQWGGTKRMVTELVQALGDPYPPDPRRRTFPTPEAMASIPLETFQAQVRMGYRSAYVHELALRVAEGELDLEALPRSQLPTADLKKELLAIKGVGNYAAATLLMLLGRYDELGVDTVFRDFVAQQYFGGRRVDDKEAMSVYAEWGRWKYLAYWFDLWQGPGETV